MPRTNKKQGSKATLKAQDRSAGATKKKGPPIQKRSIHYQVMISGREMVLFITQISDTYAMCTYCICKSL
jgi:hypothetical protein